MSFQDFCSLVCETFKSEEALWTPQFWYLTSTRMLEHIKTQEPGLIISQYEVLNSYILKLSKLWLSFYNQWAVDSFEKLYEKSSRLLAGTYKTSLNSETTNNAILYMGICLNMQPITREILSDSALMTVISTCSTTVPSAPARANVIGVGTSHAGELSLDTLDENEWGNSDEETGSLLSFISFLKSGDYVKYGLEEKAKDFKVVLAIYDLSKCNGDYERYWIGLKKKIDLQVMSGAEFLIQAENLMKAGKVELAQRGAKEIVKPPEKASGKGFKRKWRN